MRKAANRWGFPLLFLALLLWFCAGLSWYGMWDPWELGVAEAARAWLDGDASAGEHIASTTQLTAVSFSVFGSHEWSGRLPFAIGAWLTCLFAFALSSTTLGRRAALITVVVLATSPLLLLNGRHMLGAAPAFASQTAVAFFALRFALWPSEDRGGLYALGLLLTVVWSAWSTGFLLGPLPPLAATALTACFFSSRLSVTAKWRSAAISIVAVVATILVANAIAKDADNYTVWLGGLPTGGQPPAFDGVLERVFHSFAPWSAVLVAGSMQWVSRRNSSDAHALVISFAILWIAFGYVTTTVFLSRYGMATFLPVAGLAVLVASTLDDLADVPGPLWLAALLTLLMVGLLVRDFALFPNAPLSALPLSDLQLPKDFNPKKAWALCLSLFGLATAVTLVADTHATRPAIMPDLTWPKQQWRKGGIFAVWMGLAALLVLAIILFGILCWFVDLSLPSLVVRIGKILPLVASVVAILGAVTPRLLWYVGRLGRFRIALPLIAAIGVGGYVLHGFDASVSKQLSAQEVYDQFEELATQQAPLAVYRTDERAANYYADRKVESLANQNAALAYLQQKEPRWLVLPAEEFVKINVAYRTNNRAHLFAVPTQSKRTMLIANQDVANVENANFMVDTLKSTVPEVEFAVNADFGKKIELLGYNLELPQGDTVGAGQRFKIQWVWRCLANPPGSQKVFVHIDGQGRRLHGDHTPVDGRLPTQHWRAGDVIVDEQELKVPADYPTGDYPMMIGLFAGSNRMKVTTDHDGQNRVNAGVLRVR